MHNDTGTAADNYAAVAQFLKGFPEFANNDLYIAGESYAGAYVPMLALQILAHNKENALTGAGAQMNLKGILVGNGVTGAGSIPGDVSEKLVGETQFAERLTTAQCSLEDTAGGCY